MLKIAYEADNLVHLIRQKPREVISALELMSGGEFDPAYPIQQGRTTVLKRISSSLGLSARELQKLYNVVSSLRNAH